MAQVSVSGTIHLEIAIAFGQGAGTMRTSRSAVKYGLALLRKNKHCIAAIEDWGTARTVFLGQAVKCGQVAAACALLGGVGEIRAADIESALEDKRIRCPVFTGRKK